MKKIYRVITIVENDTTDNKILLTLLITTESFDGWDFEKIIYAGKKSDRPELHRYIIIFSKVEDDYEAMKYISEDVLNKNIEDFKNIAELQVYVNTVLTERLEANKAEAESERLDANEAEDGFK